MATPTKLGIYNNALLILGERMLGSLSENRKPRRLLDQAWDTGAVDACLEMGLWTFATRSVRLDYDPSIEPDFGLRYVFEKPEDYIQTVSICSDENYNVPLDGPGNSFADEGGYWYSDITPIYVRIVSNSSTYGGDMSKWPSSFTDLLEAYLAQKIATPLTQSNFKQVNADAAMEKALKKAEGRDALKKPAMRFPMGRMASARLGGPGMRNTRPGYR